MPELQRGSRRRAGASEPLLSFIVLVHNYRDYVAEAIRSILRQSVEDFEIVVVDDASTDGSGDVVRSFSDRRIRLLVNEQNRGGAWSYNRAVSAARGKFLVNLDADDWVAPYKSAIQLDAFAADPRLDIVGTYITAVDSKGAHSGGTEVEAGCNRDIDLNLVDSWVVQNPLCRSSTMMRRDAHMRIGLDDPTMVYACDWELWSRALRLGCRFSVIPEKLTYYRWHGQNITHRDPADFYLETGYVLSRNLIPVIDARATWPTLSRAINWMASREVFARLRTAERFRVIASLLLPDIYRDFSDYKARILSMDPDPQTESIGRRCLAAMRYDTSRVVEAAYDRDVRAEAEAKEFFRRQAVYWEEKSKSAEQAVEPAE